MPTISHYILSLSLKIYLVMPLLCLVIFLLIPHHSHSKSKVLPAIQGWFLSGCILHHRYYCRHTTVSVWLHTFMISPVQMSLLEIPLRNVSFFMSQTKVISGEAILICSSIVHISSINFIGIYCQFIKHFHKISQQSPTLNNK